MFSSTLLPILSLKKWSLVLFVASICFHDWAVLGANGVPAPSHPARVQVGRWTAAPALPPLPSFSDGPFAGNGDLGLTWGGSPELMTQYVGKKDFWTGAFFGHNLQRRWGMLLASTIVWDMPALSGSEYAASMQLWNAEVNFTFGRDRFHSNTFIGQAVTPHDVNFFVTEFGIDQTINGSGRADPHEGVQLTLRIQPGNPAVPSTYNSGATWGGAEPNGVVWAARNNTNNTGSAVNPYHPGPGVPQDTFEDVKLTAAWAARLTSADDGPEPPVQRTSSANGTHALSLVMSPGRRYALTYAIATRECGQGDPVAEALRLEQFVASQERRVSARASARSWWEAFWKSTPVVKHFSPEADAFYYGALYSMAGSKRLGTVGIDRQGPFMTQDNSMWPYICNNYNLQAPYFGMHATNQQWMFGPMFDRVIRSVPLYKERARHLLVNVQATRNGEDNPPPSSYGHYMGIEMPGHIGAYDWMWDGSYEGQDAGQRFDAAFTALLMIDYFDYSQNKTFLRVTAYPFLRLTVDFVESYVRNSTHADGSYSLHIHHACAQEGCVGQPAFPPASSSRWASMEYGDTTPDLAFYKYALRAAVRLSTVLGVDSDKRKQWQAIVAHLPMYSTDEVPVPNKTSIDRNRSGSKVASRHTTQGYPGAPSMSGYKTVLGAIGRQGGDQIQIHSCKSGSDWNASLLACVRLCKSSCDDHGGCSSFAVLHPHHENKGRIGCQLYNSTAPTQNDWWTLWVKGKPTPGSWAGGKHVHPSKPEPVPGTVMAISANHTPIRPFSLHGLVSYAIVYTAPMYPATDPDLIDSSTQHNNSTWSGVAVRTLQNLPAVPYNGAQQIWNAAVRAGYPAEELVAQYQPLLAQGLQKWPNFRVDFGSSNGLENAGVIDALSEMLMQSWRGYIELFPCWPSSQTGSFERLRARGAFLVSATFDPASGGVGKTVKVLSEAGGRCTLRMAWPNTHAVTVRTKGGKSVEVRFEDIDGVKVFSWLTSQGGSYEVGAHASTWGNSIVDSQRG